MTITKLTTNIKPLDEVDKINELVDGVNGSQPLLVSGTNIKTINNNSILGNGNLALDGLPSQTGNAGLYLQTDGTDASWQGVPGRNIGEIVASTIPLTDAGLHLLDGALIQGSGIYSDFVDYIADLYDSGDYTAIFETEANWQTSVTTYGVCGKFVYDSVNNTVRLPKITGIIEGTTDVSALGDLVEAGLPDHNHSYTYIYKAQLAPFGGNNRVCWEGDSTTTKTTANASLSNSIYGKSSTVQPQTIKAFYYIVIATSTKTAIQVDIDEIATDLNGKADVDLTNTSPTSAFATALNTAGIRTVVETYVNGTSWYRVYSDGWCEQGLTKSGDNEEWKSFLKPFADTNYNVQVTATGSSGVSAGDWAYVGAYPLYRETTRVYIRTYGQQNAIAYIYACGYIN